ncbi:MAG: hypothetical protein L0332_24025, partial [Chloroflexi bacterium]|nr:hypothetical protein [Chloroflexota bacterium]
VNRFAGGLQIVCDAALSPESAGGVPPEPPSNFPDTTPAKPTCIVTLDLPYPYRSDERNFWGLGFGDVIGFQPLILAGTVSIQDRGMV